VRRALALATVVSSALALGAGPVAAEPSGPARHDSRCDTLQALVPATAGVVSGNVSSTRRQARVLRALADRPHTPRRVQHALEELAQWFADARDRSLLERSTTLAALRRELRTVVTWTTKRCGEALPTVTTTLPA